MEAGLLAKIFCPVLYLHPKEPVRPSDLTGSAERGPVVSNIEDTPFYYELYHPEVGSIRIDYVFVYRRPSRAGRVSLQLQGDPPTIRSVSFGDRCPVSACACELYDTHRIKVYAARRSHATFPHPGLHLRLAHPPGVHRTHSRGFVWNQNGRVEELQAARKTLGSAPAAGRTLRTHQRSGSCCLDLSELGRAQTYP